MVDVEENKYLSKEEYRETLTEFLILLENHFNQKPLIYSETSFYNQYLANYFPNYKILNCLSP